MSSSQELRTRIVGEIKRLAALDNGRAPGRASFVQQTGIKVSQWSGVIWARWGDALEEAGLSPNKLQAKSNEEFLFCKFCEAIRHYGRVPTGTELRIYARTIDLNYPSHGTLSNNFGSKSETLLQLKNWIADKAQWADVSLLLTISQVVQPERSPLAKLTEGSVYLNRSGKHYKIRRSDEIERRVKEIRVTLPDAATLEHVIKTDDPSGIESYWHRRFADRRANGEWFALTPQDILIFKRRKFR